MNILATVLLISVACVAFFIAYRTRIRTFRGVDCVLAPWEKPPLWGDCSSPCQGLQYATRSVLQTAENDGQPCNPADMVASRTCNANVPCNQSCVPGNPSRVPWSACPNCLSSEHAPVQWKYVPPLQEATPGGTDCALDQVLQTRPCAGFIPSCPPNVDCILQPYATSTCNVECGSGTRFIYQSITQYPSGHGHPCDPTRFILQEACYGDCSCGSFTGPFTTCNAACGPGIQVRLRSVTDARCPVVESRPCQLTECDNTTCAPPSVEFIEALCFLSCSGYPVPGFAEGVCSTTAMLDAICGSTSQFSPCAEPHDCSMSAWSPFSACSVPCMPDQSGTQTRVRVIIANATGGGRPCSEEVLQDSRPCNTWQHVTFSAYDTATNEFIPSVSDIQCSVSQGCVYSAWTVGVPCDAPCLGDGSITYYRSITQFPESQYVGHQCTESLVSQDPCFNDSACVPCTWDIPTSQLFDCDYAGQGIVFGGVELLSNTNVPGDTCSGATCNFGTAPLTNGLVVYPPGLVNGQWKTLSCSIYAKQCTGYTTCPAPHGLPCNGTGVPVRGYPLGICTCSCLDGWSGSDCSTATATCPLGPTGQVCNGVGTCNGVSSVCACPNNDMTPDCTGSASSWCWLYADLLLDAAGDITDTTPIRKLLGAFPIVESMWGTFSQDECLSLTTSWDTLVTLPMFTFTAPTTVLSPAVDILTLPIRSARFAGVVRSSVPSTLMYDSNVYCPYNAFDMGLIASMTSKSDMFINRYIPGTVPMQCETLLHQRYYAGSAGVQASPLVIPIHDQGPVPLTSVSVHMSITAMSFNSPFYVFSVDDITSPKLHTLINAASPPLDYHVGILSMSTYSVPFYPAHVNYGPPITDPSACVWNYDTLIFAEAQHVYCPSGLLPTLFPKFATVFVRPS